MIDRTGLLQQGRACCGVPRHDTGSAGKSTTCPIGAFAAAVAGTGHAFIDRRLVDRPGTGHAFIDRRLVDRPKSGTGAPDRLAAAHVPDDVAFATSRMTWRSRPGRAARSG